MVKLGVGAGVLGRNGPFATIPLGGIRFRFRGRGFSVGGFERLRQQYARGGTTYVHKEAGDG